MQYSKLNEKRLNANVNEDAADVTSSTKQKLKRVFVPANAMFAWIR